MKHPKRTFIHNSRLTTSFEMLQIEDLGVKPDLSITSRFKNTPVGMGLDVCSVLLLFMLISFFQKSFRFVQQA